LVAADNLLNAVCFGFVFSEAKKLLSTASG